MHPLMITPKLAVDGRLFRLHAFHSTTPSAAICGDAPQLHSGALTGVYTADSRCRPYEAIAFVKMLRSSQNFGGKIAARRACCEIRVRRYGLILY